MVVQDLANETDVFMEFGHLSQKTRQKIEEFRRRRLAAEEYNENSPIKPPKTTKRLCTTTSKNSNEILLAQDKSLRYLEEVKNLVGKIYSKLFIENFLKIFFPGSYSIQIFKNILSFLSKFLLFKL